jgi:hypothetical protein
MKGGKLLYRCVKSAYSSGFSIREHVSLTGLLRSYPPGYLVRAAPSDPTNNIANAEKDDDPFAFSVPRHTIGIEGRSGLESRSAKSEFEVVG